MFSVVARLGSSPNAPENFVQRNGTLRGATLCGKREKQAKISLKTRLKKVENCYCNESLQLAMMNFC
jgi:hypothetical protein